MKYKRNILAQLSALAAVCSLAVWIGTTSAKEKESSVLVNKPADTAAETQSGPVLPPPQDPNEHDAAASDNNSEKSAPITSAPKQELLPTPPQTSQPSSSSVKRPFLRPAEPRKPAKGKLVGQEPMPNPDNAAPTSEGTLSVAPLPDDIHVKPAPPIDYHADHDARRMYRSGRVNITMVTQDPSDGCYYEIPMCIPACCTGEPRVSGGRGIFGRGIVEYCWPCGFSVKVKFRHILGNVKVEYEGD